MSDLAEIKAERLSILRKFMEEQGRSQGSGDADELKDQETRTSSRIRRRGRAQGFGSRLWRNDLVHLGILAPPIFHVSPPA
jgi:hypothetical protein